MNQITFQTSCYNNSYNLLLKDGLLEHYLGLFPRGYFYETNVIINNIFNRMEVEALAKSFSKIKYYFAYDETKEVMGYFDFSIDDFMMGLVYSLQHFTGIYHCNTEYLFHVSEDCNVDELNKDYIEDCIAILESNDDYIAALPRWHPDPEKGAKEEALGEDGKFFIARGFTDQTYILKTKIFKNKEIYKFKHPDSDRFPPKGGNSFEKRINSYMWCKDKYRVIHKEFAYIHGYYDNIIKGV